jgi:hypothetical protein
MHSLLLFDVNEQPIDLAAIEDIFRSEAGFHEVRRNTPIGTPIEADFVDRGDFTTVGVSTDCETISIRGTSGAALQVAWLLHTQLRMPLRMVDTEYSFDLMLDDFASIEELVAAIDSARAS